MKYFKNIVLLLIVSSCTLATMTLLSTIADGSIKNQQLFIQICIFLTSVSGIVFISFRSKDRIQSRKIK